VTTAAERRKHAEKIQKDALQARLDAVQPLIDELSKHETLAEKNTDPTDGGPLDSVVAGARKNDDGAGEETGGDGGGGAGEGAPEHAANTATAAGATRTFAVMVAAGDRRAGATVDRPQAPTAVGRPVSRHAAARRIHPRDMRTPSGRDKAHPRRGDFFPRPVCPTSTGHPETPPRTAGRTRTVRKPPRDCNKGSVFNEPALPSCCDKTIGLLVADRIPW